MKIIECPRDAMQGLHDFIPTEEKAAYINQLLRVGFDAIDFGSFVSPKAIPQMRDTAEVLSKLDISGSQTKLLAIIANERGAINAAYFPEISYLGFPLSLSETFQERNTNRTIGDAFVTLQGIQDICHKNKKVLVTYLSMGFGNPYGDPYDADFVGEFVEKLQAMEVQVISLSDTIGVADPGLISKIFGNIIPAFPAIEFGAHLHSHPKTALEKIAAAWQAGCIRFDGALKGFGGCPMAKDDLVGNMPTETIYQFCAGQQIELGLNEAEFSKSLAMASHVFPPQP